MTNQTLFLSDLDVYNGLNAAVEERGEGFLYHDNFAGSACKNFINGQPACIAGDVYYRNGLQPTDAGDWYSSTVDSLVYFGLLNFESQAGHMALAQAQDEQDAHHTWGEARSVGLKTGLGAKIAAQQEASK